MYRSQGLTPEPGPGAMAEAAAMVGAIERWSADLALGEEPARFLSALEDGAL
jgi:hypothetical protein